MTADGSDFASRGLRSELVSGLAELGYEAPRPSRVQLSRRCSQDAICCARPRRGTGKTAAFALPMLSQRAEGGGARDLRHWSWHPPVNCAYR